MRASARRRVTTSHGASARTATRRRSRECTRRASSHGRFAVAMEESLLGNVRVAVNFSEGSSCDAPTGVGSASTRPRDRLRDARRRGMKVAYVDIDAHHGDECRRPLRVGPGAHYHLHQYGMIPELGRPFFPGTGTADERGRGRRGLQHQRGAARVHRRVAYIRAFDEVVPRLSIVSGQTCRHAAGDRSHFTDPLTNLQL